MKNMKCMKVSRDNALDTFLQQGWPPGWRNIRRKLRGNPQRFER